MNKVAVLDTLSFRSGSSSACIIILDDLDRILLPEVLGELLESLDKRGPHNASWIGPTHGRNGMEESHSASCYYLHEDVYFIATMNKTRFACMYMYVC